MMKFRRKKEILNLLILGILVSSNANAGEFNQKMTGTSADDFYIQEGVLEQTDTDAIYRFQPSDSIVLVDDQRSGDGNVNLKAGSFSNKNVRFEGGVDIGLEGYGGDGYNQFGNVGVTSYVYGIEQTEGNFLLDGAMNIHIKSQGGIGKTESVGNSIVGAEALAIGFGLSSLNTIQINNDLNIDVQAIGGTAIGIHESNRLSSGAIAAGVFISSTGSTTFSSESKTMIRSYARSGIKDYEGALTNDSALSYGIIAVGSQVEMNGDLMISTKAEMADSSLAEGTKIEGALVAILDGEIADNQNGGKVIQLEGDMTFDFYDLADLTIEFPKGKSIQVKLDTKDSFWKGMPAGVNDATILNVDVLSGASWIPTGDEVITANFGTAGEGLTLSEGGILNMAAFYNQSGSLNLTNSFRTLTINGNSTLNDGAILRLNTDINSGLADRVDFANVTGEGTTYIQVAYDPNILRNQVLEASGSGILLSQMTGDTSGIRVTGQESYMDNPLEQYLVTPTVEWDGEEARLTRLEVQGTGRLSTGAMNIGDSQGALRNTFQVQSNSMMRRLGDLRLSNAESGAWARVYGGKLTSGSAYFGHFDQTYTGTEAGYDWARKVDKGELHFGFLGTYLSSSPSYQDGHSNLDSYGAGIYGSWIGNRGHYADFVVRGMRVGQDIRLGDSYGNSTFGDYHTWGYGIGLEYGYRKNLKQGWFVEPQAELHLGRINSTSFRMSNGLKIIQSEINQGSGRLGALLGKRWQGDGKEGSLYLRTSVVQNFSESGRMQGFYGDQKRKIDTLDTKGTALELNLGANVKFTNHLNGYMELTKSFGGPVQTNWQVNGGVRLMW